MKRTALIFLLMLIPIILMSNAANYSLFNKFSPMNIKNLMRTWRLNEVINEVYENEMWVQSTKNVYVYNPVFTTKVDTLKMYTYETSLGQWILLMKIAYTYDTAGQYIEQMLYMYQVMGQDIPIFRVLIDYNAQNQPVMWTIDGYNAGTMDWNLYYWLKCFYTANSINYMMMYSPPDDPDPEEWTKTTYTNDGQGRPLITVAQTSPDSLTWTNDERMEYNYDDNDTSTGEDFIHLFSTMIFAYGILDPGSADFAIMFEEITTQYYDTVWENETRELYTYNTQNQLTEHMDQVWDNGWVDDKQTTYEYDTNGNLAVSTEYIWVARTWQMDNRNSYAWGQDTANDDSTTPAVSRLKLTTSPNPFSDGVTFRINSKAPEPVKYSIYNLKGQLVRSVNAYSDVSAAWDGKDFQGRPVGCGIYFVKTHACGKYMSTKVLKLH